ncbi:acetamidase/formamidase family protein [Halovenus amylolytica]|uniref:acetamidase/formamidase family protein n=1 Tax=Halovenus amylolytica TaxID=2500550 RepID=UPI00361D3496
METVTIPRDNHEEFLLSEGIAEEDILEDELTVKEEVPYTGPGPHVVTGPIYVNDAEPGDILEVHVSDIELRAPYGINLFAPNAGALPEEFPWSETHAVPFDLETETAHFNEDIEFPLDPFFGIMAVSPPASTGRVSTGPPDYFGGNMDLRQLGVGTSIYFPVNTEGALFWAGDGHAAQGNGEICVTAAETSMTGTFNFTLHKTDGRLDWPVAETDSHYITMGINQDLDDAMKHAVRETISFLVGQKGLSPADAYRLGSMAIDFNISQVVDGNEGIHAMIPKSLFGDDGGEIDPAALDEQF